MATQKARSLDIVKNHPVVGRFETELQVSLLSEYIDLRDELGGMTLEEFLTASTASEEADADAEAAEEDEADTDTGPPAGNGEVFAAPAAEPKPKPGSMVGLRVVYRFPGRNVLSDAAGVTRDSNGTVAFTDVDGEPWSNVSRDKVYPIDPKEYGTIHVSKREAKEIQGWLESGKPIADKPEGDLLRSFFLEPPQHPDWVERPYFAIVNGKRVYVDRFVQLPDNGFEDDQKPCTRLFGEHCFHIHDLDYVVNVVTP